MDDRAGVAAARCGLGPRGAARRRNLRGGGVVGALAGVIGSMMALEAIKLTTSTE